jgi:hypothetical protein
LILLPLVLGFGLLQEPTDEVVVSKGIYIANPEGAGEPRILLQIPTERREKPKISPQHQFEFPFSMTALGKPEGRNEYMQRFRIFYQRRREENDPTPFVARALMRLWDYNYRQLKIDHSPQYNGQIVDVYLCWGGKAGAQQRFDVEKEDGVTRKVNTIYVYDLDSFSDPLEMMREIAHEYGHATLPAIGGYKSPEEWANGYLGERLYLSYLRDELAAGRLTKADTLLAEKEDLDQWVKDYVDPLIAAAAAEPPNEKLLKGKNSQAMNAYMGLVLYAQKTLPVNVFARSLVLTQSTNAWDYPKAVVLAMSEPDQATLKVGQYKGKAVWLPIGKASIQGGAVKKREGGWALVQVASTNLVVKNR